MAGLDPSVHFSDVKPTPEDREEAETASQSLGRSQELCTELLGVLFPSGVPTDISFFGRLYGFARLISLHGGETDFSFDLWFAALREIRGEQREALAMSLVDVSGPTFFEFLERTNELVPVFRWPADFMTRWLLALHRRIGDDMATGGFWQLICEFGRKQPTEAFKVLQMLESRKQKDAVVEIASRLLAEVREKKRPSSLPTNVRSLERAWRNSSSSFKREAFARSWAVSARGRALSREELKQAVAALNHPALDSTVAFSVACQILRLEATSDDNAEYLYAWLSSMATPHVSDFVKHCICVALSEIGRNKNIPSKRAGLAWDLLLKVLPIPAKHSGTWQAIERYLVCIFETNMEAWEEKLSSLAEASREQLTESLRADSSVLMAHLRKRDALNVVSRWSFSPTYPLRKIGLLLFSLLSMSKFDPDVLQSVSEEHVRITFFTFKLEQHFRSGPVCRFLQALLPLVENASASFKTEFEEELLVQMKNFPEGVMQEFDQRQRASEVAQKCLTTAKSYFERLRDNYPHATNSMDVPFYKRIARTHLRQRSHEIHERATSQSIWAQIVPEVELPYGNAFTVFRGDEIEADTEMTETQFSIELPRLDSIDPELMALRRWQAMRIVSEFQDSGL